MNQFEKRVIERVKSFKCSQPNCRSDNEDNLELIVFGKISTDKKGLMCTSCFLEDKLIKQLNKIEINVLPVRKFMMKLNQSYKSYYQLKQSKVWQPTINQIKKKQIMQVLAITENQLSKKINQIMQTIQKQVQIAIEQARTNNKDNDFQKIIEFLKQQKPVQLSDTFSSLSTRIVKVNNQYSYSREEIVKQGNQKITEKIGKIIKLGEDIIVKLIDLQKKQIQFVLA